MIIPPPEPLEQRPMGGRLWTPTFFTLSVVFLLTVPLIVWRFLAGLGAVTALSDGYPWGLWIAFDVVIGTALASGGFAVALLVFALNRWRYHPLVRQALLTAALGYTIAVVSLIVDVGRPWNFWKVPISFGDWNLDSALLEVALCVAAYTIVLWLEATPILFERWELSDSPRLQHLGKRATRVLYVVLPVLLVAGVILPMMHQSSLGTLMVLTGHKLHPLWQTPMLPLLFLLSTFAMGIGAVTLESSLSNREFDRPQETPILRPLMRIGAFALVAWVVVRLLDVTVRGVLSEAFAFDMHGLLFWVEILLFLLPAAFILSRRRSAPLGRLFRVGVLMLVAGSLYRFDAFLVAFDPGPGWNYFPSLGEVTITIGLVAGEILIYLFLVRRFPVLRGTQPSVTGEARGSL